MASLKLVTDRNRVPTAAAKVVGVCGWRVRPWGSPADGCRGDQQGAAAAWRGARERERERVARWDSPVRSILSLPFPIPSSLFNLQIFQLMEINLTLRK